MALCVNCKNLYVIHICPLHVHTACILSCGWLVLCHIAGKFGGGKFGEFGEFDELYPWFAKLKASKLELTINNLLADLLICQTFFCRIHEKSQFVPPAKLSHHTVYSGLLPKHTVKVFSFLAFCEIHTLLCNLLF